MVGSQPFAEIVCRLRVRECAKRGPLAVVGVVRCMGRSLGIAGELTSCALFVFPQVSLRLVALHLHVYIYIYLFFRCCVCQTAYNSRIVWPGVPPFKFPPARPLVQGAVADKGDEARWCAKCGPRCPLIQLPVVGVLAQVPKMFALELCIE